MQQLTSRRSDAISQHKTDVARADSSLFRNEAIRYLTIQGSNRGDHVVRDRVPTASESLIPDPRRSARGRTKFLTPVSLNWWRERLLALKTYFRDVKFWFPVRTQRTARSLALTFRRAETCIHRVAIRLKGISADATGFCLMQFRFPARTLCPTQMVALMLFARHHLQIFSTVVTGIPVAMMNDLRPQQRTPKHPTRDQSMLINPPGFHCIWMVGHEDESIVAMFAAPRRHSRHWPGLYTGNITGPGAM